MDDRKTIYNYIDIYWIHDDNDRKKYRNKVNDEHFNQI